MVLLLIYLRLTQFVMTVDWFTCLLLITGLALSMSKEQQISCMGQLEGWVILQTCFARVLIAEIYAIKQ